MTPLIKIGDVYLKREDQNLTGSAKDQFRITNQKFSKK